MSVQGSRGTDRVSLWAREDGILHDLAMGMLACGVKDCDWITAPEGRMCGRCRREWDAAAEIERLRELA